MDDNQSAAFYAEQFKEHWAYMRHIEEMRVKQLNMYFLLVAGVLGLVAIRDQQAGTFESVWLSLVAAREATSLVLAFLSVYGLAVVGFTVGQKGSYEHFRALNHAITVWFLERGKPAPYPGMSYPHPTHIHSMSAFLKGTFIHSLLAPVLVTSTLLGLLVGLWVEQYVVVAFLIVFLVALAAQLGWCYTNLRGSSERCTHLVAAPGGVHEAPSADAESA